MTKTEMAWFEAVAEGYLPSSDAGPRLLPPEGGFASSAVELTRASTGLAALGLRFALLLATLAPIWLGGRWRLLPSLAPAERGVLLARMLGHRSFAVRELGMFLKVATCMALFRSDAMRAQTHYDPPDTSRAADVQTRGQTAGAGALLPADALRPKRGDEP
ncbi:MAG: hypothetical protein R3A78_06975 [Polyangiales bacterium]